MNGVQKAGFTIIETMLFLSITGLMVIGMLATAGVSIAQQRYQDSVSTLESNIAGLYSSASNVVNDRDSDLSCDSNAVITTVNSAPSVGQSDCVVIGRYMTIQSTDISTSTVIGYNASPTSNGTIVSDIDQLKAYKLSVLSSSTQTTQLDWGASIAWAKSGPDSHLPTSPRTIAILVLNSLQSGRTYTFTADNTTTTLKGMIVAGANVPGQAQRRLCVSSSGPFNGGLAVVIGAYASTLNDIQIRSNDMGDTSVC